MNQDFKSLEFAALSDLHSETKRTVEQLMKRPSLTEEQVLALSDLYTTLVMVVNYKLDRVDTVFKNNNH